MVTVITPTQRNQGIIQISGVPTADTDVSVGAASTALIAANLNRKLVLIVNTGAGNIRVRFGATATVGTGIQLRANGGSLVLDNILPVVVINAISESGTNAVSVTEW